VSSKHTITAVFERFGAAVKQQGHLHAEQLKILELHYNSCGNRHCPNCQGVNRERWVLKRSEDLLPITYFHGVFTVPRELRSLFLYNKKTLYNLLFRCVWETIQSFSADPRQTMQAKTGMGELHIPNTVGLWNSPAAFYNTKRTLYNKKWVVYNKPSFDGATQVMEYLGRYTHRIAISNHRIIKVTATHVTFRYLDRCKQKTASQTLTGEAFVLRFLRHVLPKRFTKIRHYGFLSTRSKQSDLTRIRKALAVVAPEKLPKLTAREVLIKTTGVDPFLCPNCKTDSMRLIAVVPPIRGSPKRPFGTVTPMKNPYK